MKRWLLSILAGPCLFLVCVCAIPDAAFHYSARVCIGTVVWMAYWWIAQPISLGATGLIPLAVNALFNVVPMSGLLGNYMNANILLVFAANILSLTWDKTGFSRRIALKFLGLFGTSVPAQFAAWLMISSFLSSILPNIPTCALLLPIAAAMLAECGHEDIGTSHLGMMILSIIAWGAGLGGMGTPLGGAMNLLAVSAFESVTGHEFSYLDWFVRIYPVMILFMLAILGLLILIRPRHATIRGSKSFYREQYALLPPMDRNEWASVLLFLLPALLCFARPLYQGIFPAAENAYVFVLFALLSFCIPKTTGEPMNTWKDLQPKISWGMLWMLGGGFALGTMMVETGVTTQIADILGGTGISGGFGLVVLLCSVCILFAEFCNNTTSAAISLPIAISICEKLGVSPIPYLYAMIPAFNTAFTMPTSIRAMPLSHGVTAKFEMKYGLALTALSLVVLPLIGYGLMTLFPAWMSAA